MNEWKWMNWHEWMEMNELTWMNWTEWIEMKELTWMNWHEWIEMHESTWRTWHEGIETNALTIFQWMNELRWMNWDECIEMNELNGKNAKSVRNPSVFLRFLVKSSSRCSLVHILWTTSPDRGSHPRKHRPSSGDYGRPLYLKKTRVLRPRVLSSVNFMMMWLPWWWDS